MPALGDKGDALSDALEGIEMGYIDVVEKDPAVGRLQLAGDEREESRFSRAIRPEDCQDVALVEAEAHLFQRSQVAVVGRHALQTKHRHEAVLMKAGLPK